MLFKPERMFLREEVMRKGAMIGLVAVCLLVGSAYAGVPVGKPPPHNVPVACCQYGATYGPGPTPTCTTVTGGLPLCAFTGGTIVAGSCHNGAVCGGSLVCCAAVVCSDTGMLATGTCAQATYDTCTAPNAAGVIDTAPEIGLRCLGNPNPGSADLPVTIISGDRKALAGLNL